MKYQFYYIALHTRKEFCDHGVRRVECSINGSSKPLLVNPMNKAATIPFLLVGFLAITSKLAPLTDSLNARSLLQRDRQIHTSSHHPICVRIPLSSSTFLWNKYSQDIAAYVLRPGIRTRPKWTLWKQLLDSVERKVQDQNEFRIGMLVSEMGMEEYQYWRQELSDLGESFHLHIHLSIYFEETEVELEMEQQVLHLVIDARSGGGTQSHDAIHSTLLTTDYENSLRAQRQDWIRRCLLKNCTLLLLDPTHGNGLWHDTTYTRILQQLADWYQIPFLSLATLSTQLIDPWKLVIKLVLFASLDNTILCCHTTHPEDGLSPLLKPGVEHTVERILPPLLDLSLSLQEVTRLWKSTESVL